MGATERIKKYLENKGISKYRFCKELGFSKAFLDNTSNVGSDKLDKILNHYTDINPEWLLTGRGNMLRLMDNVDDGSHKTKEQNNIEKTEEFIQKIGAQIKEYSVPPEDLNHLKEGQSVYKRKLSADEIERLINLVERLERENALLRKIVDLHEQKKLPDNDIE